VKLLAVFFIVFNLYANDILTEYRLHGLDGIEKKMDYELGDPSYWKKFLKDKDTSFGYSEVYTNILACNKKDSTLKFYRKDKDRVIQIKKFGAFTGKESGQKREEGDLRTPIGVYKLTRKLDKVDQFYGPMAFVTSYPNTFDKYEGRDGHGIWIHGLPLDNEDRENFTKGCIAIDNKNIMCLNDEIDISKTLLIIDDKEIKKDISKNVLANILANVYQWRYSWLYSKIDDYLAFYDKDFIRFDKMDFKRFKTFKTIIFNRKEKKSIIFKDISIVKYPDKKDIYQVTFHEFYHTKRYQFSGNKTLIIKLKNNKMKIITEK